MSCWAAVAAVGCTGETQTGTPETTKQALSVVAAVSKAPTSYTAWSIDPLWSNPANAYSRRGGVASASRQYDTVAYSGFDFSTIPADAIVDRIDFGFDLRKTRTNNCSVNIISGTLQGQAVQNVFDTFDVTTNSNTTYSTGYAPTGMTGATVRTNGFGAAIQVNTISGGDNCAVELDYMEVVVSYHKCDPGTWWNSTARTCSACDASCATCNGAGTAACTSCGANKYVRLNAGSSSVGSCADCGSPTCAVDQYPVACGTYQPASCAACPNCSDPDQYVASCNSNGTSVCTPITHCGAGQRVLVPFTSRSNQQCTACTAGTYNTSVTDLNLETDACYACPTGTWSDYTEGSVGPTGCYFIPQVMSISPASGVTDGGDAFVVSGSHFAPTAKVLFGTTPATSVVVSADGTQITARTPAHAIGTVDVMVDNNDGHVRRFSNTLAQAFTFQGAAVPLTLSGLSPATGLVAGGTTVTINGGGFVVGSTNVQFGGVAATNVTVLSPTQLTAVSPAHAVGVVNVVVINGRGGMGTLSNSFTYTDSLPPADIDAGTDDAGTGTVTSTATSATNTGTGTGTSAVATATVTATSAVATATGTSVVTTSTSATTATSAVSTATGTSVVVVNTNTSVVTSATNTVTGTVTSAVATATNTNTVASATNTVVSTGTKTGATSTTTSVTTGSTVDAGVDAVVVADGGAVDTKPVVVDGGVDGAVVTPSLDAAVTPGRDAGAGVDASVKPGDAAVGTDAATPVTKKDDDGCSCNMGSSSAHQNGGVILLVLGSVLVAIRRKRTRR